MVATLLRVCIDEGETAVKKTAAAAAEIDVLAEGERAKRGMGRHVNSL